METTSEVQSSEAREAVRQLRTMLDGRVVVPEDGGYDEARALYFTGLDRRPAAIVRVSDAGEVARVIGVARDAGVELSVRGGGHSLAGHGVSDGGVVADLSLLRSLDIDPAARTAWAGAGLTAAEYTTAAAVHGLATGFGDAGSVGIGGITLGGGVGFLHRKLGLTIDSVTGAEVVTAGGQILNTDAETHPDLFWAIRGGGGNFGVVTRLRYRLHEVDPVVGGMVMIPVDAERATRFINEFQAAPEELSGLVNIMMAPPMPMIPAEHHGKVVLMAMLVYAGGREAGERALAPFRSLATPIIDTIEPMRFARVYEEEGGPPPPRFVAIRSAFIDGFSRSDADAVLEHLRSATARMSTAQFRVLGGAVARVPAEATAFAHRDRGIMMNIAAMYDAAGERETHAAWSADLASALGPGRASGAYVGFLGDEGEARVREAYPGATWDRLARIKARYDPGNLFRVNQNVPPLAVPAA